ncbi:Cdc16, putative [Leishmania tarentolae]|uniref:Cdc16, putative n=1 Tax=Leishmania tarentolae TaxID=5689 RepID=A0A640KLQ6_LEITA|nr:Cdc16, putative [Leishmania tarentolae]
MDGIRVLKENALRLLSDGQPLSALHLVEILCEMQPNSDENRSLKIRCLYELREFDSVLKLAKQVTFACDQNSEVFLLAVKAAFELGDLKRCVQYAMTLINADSSKVVAMCFVAKAAECPVTPRKLCVFTKWLLRLTHFVAKHSAH